MASVFLSYDREDVGRARPIAAALEKAGHSVWWDRHIKGGAQYSKEIEKALRAADAVVVLWSERSAESAWVRDEAAAGRDSGRLVPVRIDGIEPPLGFRQFQTIDLNGRIGGRSPQLADLLAAIHALSNARDLEGEERERAGPAISERAKRSRAHRPLAILLTVAVIVLLGVLAWNIARRSSSPPVVAIAAANPSPGSEALARNLLIKLGSLQAAKTDALRLVGANAGERIDADLLFETSGSNDPGSSNAGLALLAAKNGSLLWSKDFRKDPTSQADLNQQMAYTAGQVLGCALEASKAGEARINQQTLKLFLNGCALFGEQYSSDPAVVIPIFSKVVSTAPRFQPAWRKLLLAEAQLTRAERLFYARLTPGAIPEHLAVVQRLNPQIPEIFVAKSALLPLTAFTKLAHFTEQALQLDPDNPDLLVVRSEFLLRVGRMGEALELAARAAEIDPLSPGLRAHLIQTLAYSGRFATAWEELRRAEQLWPGTAAIEDARLRLTARYGDAKEALHILSSDASRRPSVSPDLEAFLLARANPTEENVQRAIRATRTTRQTDPRTLGNLVQALGEFHREDELYDVLMNFPRAEFLGDLSEIYFRPALVSFRRDPRFMQVAKRAGLLNYWRTSRKWPDFCFEADLHYDCKTEAANLAG